MEVDEIALLELNGDQNVCSAHRGEEEVPAGHARGAPEGNEKA